MGGAKQGKSIVIVTRSGASNLAAASISLSNGVQIEMGAAVWVLLLCSVPGLTHLVWSVCDFHDLASTCFSKYTAQKQRSRTGQN